MKKTLITLAVLAASGAATAQSSPSVSGYVQFQYLNAPKDDTKGVGIAFANLTISGSEDLGGGLKANYSSEIGLGEKRGESAKKRDTSLGLSGGWGSLTVANTRSSSLLVTQAMVGTNNNGWYGPYDYSGEVVSRTPVDSVSYSTDVGPIGLTVEYAESANDGNAKATITNASVSASYSAGPLGLVARVNNGSSSVWAGAKNKQSFELGGNYDFGVAKVGLAIDTRRVGESKAEKGGVAFGVGVPVGAATFGIGSIKRGDANLSEFRVNYAFSKRTDIEFNYGKSKDSARNFNYSQIVLSHAF